MIQAGIQKILDISKEVYEKQIDGRLWVNKKLERVPLSEEYAPVGLSFNTLNGLKDFVKDFTPTAEIDRGDVFFHVESPIRISLCGQLQTTNFNKRFIYASADMDLESFKFSTTDNQKWYDLELFIISLQSLFVQNDDLELILDNAGHVADENIIEHKDDRIAQSLVVKTGIASRGTVQVKNPVILKPFRTFREVDQPESRFVLRWRKAGAHEVQSGSIGVKASLWVADGGQWSLNAMRNIKNWLATETGIKVVA